VSITTNVIAKAKYYPKFADYTELYQHLQSINLIGFMNSLAKIDNRELFNLVRVNTVSISDCSDKHEVLI
jgi:hypothetical protein